MINTRKHLISNKDDSQKRARILLRVSSDQQLDEGRDLITQRKIVEEYVASHPDSMMVMNILRAELADTKIPLPIETYYRKPSETQQMVSTIY